MVQLLQESYTKTIERLFGSTFKTYLQGLLKAGQQVSRVAINPILWCSVIFFVWVTDIDNTLGCVCRLTARMT